MRDMEKPTHEPVSGLSTPYQDGDRCQTSYLRRNDEREVPFPLLEVPFDRRSYMNARSSVLEYRSTSRGAFRMFAGLPPQSRRHEGIEQTRGGGGIRTPVPGRPSGSSTGVATGSDLASRLPVAEDLSASPSEVSVSGPQA